ncbi:hypothetical protein DINM_005548 [Dirofilaria immitis]|nr:hypothetical protein [Dirofilaria immitis]
MSKPDERFVCQNRFGPPKKIDLLTKFGMIEMERSIARKRGVTCWGVEILCWFIPICKNPQAIIVLSPTMTKCKCGCHEGKQCTCKECPDKSEGKENVVDHVTVLIPIRKKVMEMPNWANVALREVINIVILKSEEVGR